jgi:hypothetical protein
VKEIKLSELKKKFPKLKKQQKSDTCWTENKLKLRKEIENSITVYDRYDEANGIYGTVPPTVITGKEN